MELGINHYIEQKKFSLIRIWQKLKNEIKV